MNLREYTALIREIKQLDLRIATLEDELADMGPVPDEVSDVVTRGKKGKKSLGKVKVKGIQDYTRINAKRAELRERIQRWKALQERAEASVGEIERLVSGIEDPDTRRLVGFYVLDGFPNWEQVAEEMGEGWTAEACRKRYSRYTKEVEDGGV